MPASRRTAALTMDTLTDLPVGCRSCLFWEKGPVGDRMRLSPEQAVAEKEAWLSRTLLEWGNCGSIAYVDNTPVGYALYAPPGFVPRADSFPTSPPSHDSVLLLTARVEPGWRSAGIGRMLAQSVAAQLVQRNVRAIEVFGSPDGRAGCRLPVDFLLAVGFKTARAHPSAPRMRMELKSTVSWRAEVESALERIFGSGLTPSRAGTAHRAADPSPSDV